MKYIYFSMMVVSTLFATPNPPSDLTFDNVKKNSLTLHWIDNSDDESGFKVFRDDKLISVLDKDVTSYVDRGLKPSTTYKYTIKATDNPKDSTYTFENYTTLKIDEQIDDYMITNVKLSKENTLIDTSKGVFYLNAEGFKVDYEIFIKDGGFDINYFIENKTADSLPLPTLRVPGINFNSDSKLDIVNPLLKHYMQDRDLNIENSYKKDNKENHRNNYFAVANLVVTKKAEEVVNSYELHYPYGRQFVYSPVIVAKKKDSGFSVGASIYPTCGEEGCSKLLKDSVKLHSLMGIQKVSKDNWYYEYDLSKSMIEADKHISVTISVRFASEKNWIFTLYPYKEFLQSATSEFRATQPKRDLRAIHSVEMGDFKDNNHTWQYLSADKNGNLQLKELFESKYKDFKKGGIQRALFWNFTGLYDDKIQSSYGNMKHQLPFQFASRDAEFLKKRNIYDDYIYLENNQNLSGIEMGYDWGISGNIPIDEDGEVLAFDEWDPVDIVKFDLTDESHLNYAKYYLNEAKELKTIFTPKFIRLDALSRMDRSSEYIDDIKRIEWIEYLKKSMPDVTFATESSLDYIHSLSASILQVDSEIESFIDDEDKNESYAGDMEVEGQIKEADYLANYLNPQAENYIWVSAEKYENINEYLKSLTANGYTPLIKYWGVIGVNGIDTTVAECMNGIDDDNDGFIDWPYESDCESPSDRNENR